MLSFRFVSLIRVVVLTLTGLSLFVPALLQAQDASSMAGTVTDASGALVPNATVVLSNSLTGVRYMQTTDKQGSYRFANVPPNEGYTAVFHHDGFASVQVDKIVLSVGITRTQNARLVAGTTEVVDVSAANQKVTLNTTDASVGNNIDVHLLNELPVYDRTSGIATLFYQQPGVDSNQGAVTGARIDQSGVTVDGLDVNDIAAGATLAIIAEAPIDSVAQFTGTVAGFVPSVGTGSGAQFQLVTKSGTNQFHGNINEYHRDTTTTANTWFNNLVGLPRTPLIRNQFGGNVGGPIKKDKLFFFLDIADSRIVQSTSSEVIVPLSGFRNGTLNYINSGAGCNDSSRLNTQPTCITTLSATKVAMLDPAGVGFNWPELAFINSRYPVANDLTRGDGVNTGGYRFTTPTPDNEITYVGRVDYNLTPTQRIFGRFTINRENSIATPPQFPTDPVTHPVIDRSYGYVVSHTWMIGKNKVNQFYYGDNVSKLSSPDLFNPTGDNQYSFSGLDGPYTAYDGQTLRVPVPMIRDDFNWQLGRHSLTMGGTFKFIKTNSNLINNFNFVGVGLQGPAFEGGLGATVRPVDINNGANQVAVNDYDSLFATSLGVIGQISTNFNYNNAGVALPAGTGEPKAYRYYQTELYAGDTWRVNPRLTLSYGLRYQLYSVPYEVHGEESVAYFGDKSHQKSTLSAYIAERLAQSASGDTSPMGLPFYSVELGGKANKGPNLYEPSYKDFAPRVAFSYSPHPNMVFNGGGGIIYDRTVITAINFLQDQVSYLFSNSQNNNFGSSSVHDSLLNAPRLGANLSYSSSLNPMPAPLTVPYTPYVDSDGVPYGLADSDTNFIISPNLKDPYSIFVNFGFQQEFPGHLVMKLNYVGRFGRRLLADADAAQILDFPDHASSQMMSAAFAGLTTQLRAGTPVGSLTPEPWFEDVLGNYQGIFGDNTNLVAAIVGQHGNRGDMSDMLRDLATYTYSYGFTGLLPTNVGMPSQFGSNAYLTNDGNSSYNGLLLTLSKNMSQGLRFDVNYTWSHSIDNTSLSANNNALFTDTGFICDITRPRACRGSSDFDVTNEINSNFVYELPIGRGKEFLAKTPRWIDEVIGGWSVSGLPSYRTGLAVTPFSKAYLASFNNEVPAIFHGNKGDLKSHVNVSNGTVYNFAGGAAGAAKVLNEFSGPVGLQYGQRNILRGPGAFFFDAGLSKKFPIIPDRVSMTFRADAFNILNHPTFGTPAVNIVSNASTYGQITDTNSEPGTADQSARVAQFSLRLEF